MKRYQVTFTVTVEAQDEIEAVYEAKCVFFYPWSRSFGHEGRCFVQDLKTERITCVNPATMARVKT